MKKLYKKKQADNPKSRTLVLRTIMFLLTMCVVGITQSFATKYYLNDNTTGEPGSLCSAVGDDANPGTADLPKFTIAGIRSVIAAGDTVYIDLGTYDWGSVANHIGSAAGGDGTSTDHVKFIGVDSTNTIISGTTKGALVIDGAIPSYWDFSKIKFSATGQNALQFNGSTVSNFSFTDCVFESTGKSAIETPGGQLTNVAFTNCRIQSDSGPVNFTGAGGPGGITYTSFTGSTFNHTGANATTVLAIGFGIMNNFTFDKCTINNAGTGNVFNMPGGQYNNWTVSNCIIKGVGSGEAFKLNSGSTYINFQAFNNYIFNTAVGIDVNGAANASGMSFQHNSFYTTGTCFKADGGSSGGTNVRDNIFYTTGAYCVELLNSAAPTTMDYNLYYYPNGKIANQSGVDYATLVDWQNVFNSNDTHSITGDPKYSNVTTGDLNINCNSPAFHAGLYVDIQKDINNSDRANPGPSIGASEGALAAGTISISPSDTDVCTGTSVTLTASGATNLSWSPATDLDVTTGATVISTPSQTTTYTVTGDNAGCSTSSTVTITVKSSPDISVTPANPVICGTGTATLTASGADSYTWSPATGLDVTTGDVVVADITATQTYTVTGTGSNGCTDSKDVTVTVSSKPTIVVTAVDDQLCKGESTDITASGAVDYTWSPSTDLNQSTGATVTSTPGAPTTYTVTGTDANGCQNTSSIDITVNDLPVVTANATDNLICEGTEVTLSGTGAASYSWDNNVTDGVAFTPASTNIYTVIGTDANGCKGTAQVTVTLKVCTGVMKPSNSISLEVYPNPNHGTFTLQFDSKKSESIEVIVYDSKGMVQYRGLENTGNGQVSKILNLNLPKGIYQIQLISDDVNSTQKFVVD